MSIIRVTKDGHISTATKGIAQRPEKITIAGITLDLPAIKAKEIGKGNLGLHVDVTYRRSSRGYDLISEGTKLHKFAGDRFPTFALSSPIYDPTGGNANAYILMGRKWTLPANVIMSLKDDAILAATEMDKTKALAAIGAACKEWNRCCSGKPFNEQANLTTLANWKKDGVNNIAFTPYAAGCTALAATGVWFKTQGIPAGTMYPIVESDMTVNSRLKWTCDPAKEPTKLDFQSVILHELGHTLGLGDIYNKTAFKADTRQVMHYYTGVKRTLGNGDCTGVWRLYG